MWAGVFSDDKADNTTHRVQYEGTFVESYFSPTDLVAFEVWNELADADGPSTLRCSSERTSCSPSGW